MQKISACTDDPTGKVQFANQGQKFSFLQRTMKEQVCIKKEKVCNLMSFVSNKGRKIIYLNFQWKTVQVGAGEDKKDILERVTGKFKAHREAKKIPVMAVVSLIKDASCKGKCLTPLSPILSCWLMVWI